MLVLPVQPVQPRAVHPWLWQHDNRSQDKRVGSVRCGLTSDHLGWMGWDGM